MRAWFPLAVALLAHPAPQAGITLEVRTFNGTVDVSDVTRVVIHRAGQRDQPVAQINVGTPRTVTVAPGIYDAQAIQEQAGQVAHIRWAERLVVMPYPDEAGHHVEVINFQTGFGALEVRGARGRASDANVMLFTPSDHSRATAMPTSSARYALFVVRAGQYDIHVRRGSKSTWHKGIDVPLDRTRLWIVP